jgi:hypothetical protein
MAMCKRRSRVLADGIEPYRRWLAARGHSLATVRWMLRKLSQLGWWPQRHGRPADHIHAASVRAMFEHGKRDGHRTPDTRGMPVVDQFLRQHVLLVERDWTERIGRAAGRGPGVDGRRGELGRYSPCCAMRSQRTGS